MKKLITLDETGTFDLADTKNYAVFIGGISKKEENDKFDNIQFEKEVENLLKDTINKYNNKHAEQYKYPDDLHMSFNQDNDFKNFKNAIVSAVKSFIKNNKCELWAYFVPSDKDEIEVEKSNNLLNEQVGDNLYEAMSKAIVIDHALHDFGIQYESKNSPNCFYGYIAKRSRKLQTMGGNTSNYDTNRNWAFITDTAFYKTAITDAMTNEKIDVDIEAESINYYPDSSKPISNPLLYLSDIAVECIKSLRRDRLNNNINQNGETTDLAVFNYLTKKKVDIRIYGKSDKIYQKMVRGAFDADLYAIIDGKWILKEYNTDYSAYYLENKVQAVENYVSSHIEQDDAYRNSVYANLDTCIEKITSYFEKNANYKRGEFLLNEFDDYFKKIQEKYCSSDQNISRAIFMICDLKLRSMYHKGEINNLNQYVGEAEMHKSAVSLDTYFAFSNRKINYCLNQFLFKQAKKEAEELIEKVEEDKNSQNKIRMGFGQNAIKNETLGKIYSTCGQIYAFCKDYGQSEECFKKALEEFSVERENETENRARTLQYLLQMYLESENYDDYKKSAKELFKSDNLREQFKNIWNEFDYNSEDDIYLLFLFIKSLVIVYSDSQDACSIVNEIVEELKKKKVQDEKFDNKHPYELIYKHLFWFMYYINYYINTTNYTFDERDIEYVKKRALDCIEFNDTTIGVIQAKIKLDFEIVANGESFSDGISAKKTIGEKYFNACNAIVAQNLMDEKISQKQLHEWLKDRVTYTYS